MTEIEDIMDVLTQDAATVYALLLKIAGQVLNPFGDMRRKFRSIVPKLSSLGGVFGVLKTIMLPFAWLKAAVTYRFRIP
ncbi:hypothetical protein GUF51_03825, partial [Xanthomonas citri pv. citri]|nr:hypothetical protein [Xanthomonas citri pv. citri]